MASPDFAKLYSNALPGFFSLQSAQIPAENPLAKEFVAFRDSCKSTIRSTYQILSRGTPNLENETWVESANVINGTDTPDSRGREAAEGPRQLVPPGEVSASSSSRPRAPHPEPTAECGVSTDEGTLNRQPCGPSLDPTASRGRPG